ncbi:MAG: hypothetical protein LBE16_04220 [Clostridiales Family XIII bacterium]|jgi:hypothetical protein|nr:hypothetical protein [Clostridiales Family XIII bacterium]
MKEYSKTLRIGVDALLREDYRLWEEAGLPPLAPEARYAAADAAGSIYDGPRPHEFAAACQCYHLFRLLHLRAEEFPEAATLLGDYFFSRFSAYLIPQDNVPLTLAFADCLARDAAARADGGRNANDADGEPAFISAIREALRR